MRAPSLFFVGQPHEVQHHAAPLAERFAVQIVGPEQVVQIALPGDLAIFYSEHFDRFRVAIQQLKQQQVGTLYLLDGILEWRNAWENRSDEPACPFTMRPVLAHKAACIGPSQARILYSWGNSGKTEIVGIPRFDKLQGKQRIPSLSGVFRVLVMTAKTPGFTDDQLQRTKQSLVDLKNWFEQSNYRVAGREIQVVWRLTAGLDREIGVANELSDLTGRELPTLLTQVDAVISTPSTAMLEAMLLGLPVAALDYYHCPNYLKLAWTIHNTDSIGTTLRELINPPESKLFYQQSQLTDVLYMPVLHADLQTPLGPTATDRLETLVQEMLRSMRSQVTVDQPLRFADRILAPINLSSTNEFDHAKIYPLAPEFANPNLVELQVELAHARREIQHVQRELAQVQSELDLAHSIFEQIQQHPIAGPIVRLRQKFLDWFARNEKTFIEQ